MWAVLRFRGSRPITKRSLATLSASLVAGALAMLSVQAPALASPSALDAASTRSFVAAGTAMAGQPVTVDFTAHGTALFNAEMSPGTCNGSAPVYATITDAIPFSWEAKFNTTINNDDTIASEPGYLVDDELGSQSATVVGSGGDGSSACHLALAVGMRSCPSEVPVDLTGAHPQLTDADVAARQPSPSGYEDVDIQGPVNIGQLSPTAVAASIGCELAFNDVSMLDASLPEMFTAHIRLPHEVFFDPSTGETHDSWSSPVTMPVTSPVDGSACAAGNNSVAYVHCSKDVDWSGTVTVTPRADDCTEGITAPPTTPCQPAKPVVPFASVTGVTGPSGNSSTTGAATATGGVPVSVSVSGPGTITGSLTTGGAATGGSRSHVREGAAASDKTVIARGRAAARKAGKVKLKLRLTRAGKALLRSWRKPILSAHLSVTITSIGHHRSTRTLTVTLRRTTKGKSKRR
jgi:hypothetical protein